MEESVTFTQAYCQVPLCSPSRTSLLTGLRPDTNRVWQIGPYFRNTMGKDGDKVIALPQYFKQNGYYVSGAGKIFHQGTSSGGSGHIGGGDMPYSWSEDYWFCDQFWNGTFQSPASVGVEGSGCKMTEECKKCQTDNGLIGTPKSHAHSPCDDACFPDGAVADEVIRQLRRAKNNGSNTPFFIAGGMKRPHLVWYANDESFSLYDNLTDVAKLPYPPPGSPPIAFNENPECDVMSDLKPIMEHTTGYKLVPLNLHSKLRQAYRSTISFVDTQIGKIIDELKALDLFDSTIIAFWGDHGYHIGEQGCWGKMSCYENAARVPLIFSIPGHRTGEKSQELVELLDVFPTLVDFAGLPPLKQNQGSSLRPQIENPDKINPEKKVFTSLTRNGVYGLTMRTHEWRYTEYMPYKHGVPDWNSSFTVELYDHRDSDGTSFDVDLKNLAVISGNLDTTQKMGTLLRKSWPLEPFIFDEFN